MNNGYYGYVYLITNLLNGKKYVGMRASPVFDETYYGSGVAIINAVNKYGTESFKREILHWCRDPEELTETEVSELLARKVVESTEYYNIIDTKTPILFGEDNGFYGKSHTEDTKEKLRQYRLGRTLSEETKQRLREYNESEEGKKKNERISRERQGVPITEDHKEKIRYTCRTDEYRKNASETKLKFYESPESDALREALADAARERFSGVPKTEEHKKKISEAHKGTTKDWVKNKINRNPEKIRKTAEAHRGMKRSPQARKNISDACKGRVPHNKGCYYCYNILTGERLKLRKGDTLPHGYAKGYRKPKV